MKPFAINLEALTVLDAIDQRGSFAAAAEYIDKVPSALSYIVQKMEEQLEISLFQKQGRRSVLTPAGKHLLQEGRKILAAVNQVTEQTKTIANGWESKICISIDSILTCEPIFKCLASFLQQHPNIEIDVCEHVMNGNWEALLNDKVDLVVGAPAPVPQQKGIRATKISQLNHVLVAAPSHPLAQKNTPLTATELKSFRSVVVHDSSKYEVPWTVNIIEGTRSFYVSTVAQKHEAIKAGIGIGFLTRERVHQDIENGDLVELTPEQAPESKEIYIASKIINKGLGLKRLREMLEQSFSEKQL